VPRRRLNHSGERTEGGEEAHTLHTPIKYNQEASLNFVKFCERRRGGILASL
jgi:hypothetical protein